jgi:hypothetical protein
MARADLRRSSHQRRDLLARLEDPAGVDHALQKTVEAHLARASRKLGIESRAQLSGALAL